MHTRAHVQAYAHTTAQSTASVSPAAIAAALNANPRRGYATQPRNLKPSLGQNLKVSISTPNLRSMFGMRNAGETGGGKKNGNVTLQDAKRGEVKLLKPAKTQYAAETWCDALMFPRPRFRAHLITPPSSPEETGNDFVILKAVERTERPKLNGAVTAPVQSSSLSPALPTRSPPLDFPTVISGHSFPQDNVARKLSNDARMSPTGETIRRVVAEGERREQERAQWSELAQSSFQNRRSRSLSRPRTRKKSGAATEEHDRTMGRARVSSDAGTRRPRPRTGDERTQGLGRTLTTLAAEAFRQPTPTISVVSHGGDFNTHSRNTSESVGHRQGHMRNTSWSKTALKQLCASEEDFSDAIISPEEVKQEKLEGALMHQNTAKIRVRGRKEEAEEADVQFLDIAPAVPTTNNQRMLAVEERDQRSNSQNSHGSNSLDIPNVGIALSTPPEPASVEDLPDLSAHPYAQSPVPRFNADPVPVSAPYAGPHPTSHDYNRHRLPPHVSLNIKPPEQRMYAILQSGNVRQVSTPEISQTPTTWDRRFSVSPNAYAYASVAADDKRESTLGVEEVLLSRSFQRGGDTEAENIFLDNVIEENEDSFPSREPSPLSTRATPRVKRKPVALKAHSGVPSLSHTVTSATHTDIVEPGTVQHAREVSMSLSSPSSQGSSSSRMSPRPLGSSIDDLEHFRDLFYKPGRSGPESVHTRTSLEGRRVLGSRDGSLSWRDDRIKSTEGLNGLMNLTRQLSEDYSGIPIESHGEDGTLDERMDRHSPVLPGLNDESLQIGTPLRAEYEGQDFPEDIQSSRASSIIDHDLIEGMPQ